MNDELITAEWLHEIGFRWHQLDRQPDKHWLLWLGNALGRMTSFEDLGMELAPGAYEGPNQPTSWFCWLRADTSHRYSRFLHVRHLKTRAEVTRLIEALSGQPFQATNTWGGSLYTGPQIESLNRSRERLDHQFRERGPKWHDVEKDDSRGPALADHLKAHADSASGDGK